MRNGRLPIGCACCSMSRRGFLAAGCAAACAGAASVMAAPRIARAAESGSKPRIKILYSLHEEVQSGPDWPNKGFDFRPVMERTTAALTQGCPELAFTTAMANGPEQAAAIVAENDADGYVVFQMNCWNQVVQTAAQTGKPVLYVDFQYGGSGGFLVYTAGFLRSETPNLGFVASSDPEDLIAAARCLAPAVRDGGFAAAAARTRRDRTPGPFDRVTKADALQTVSPEECAARFRDLKILAVRDTESGEHPPVMGIPVSLIPFAELNAAWEGADQDEARAIADRWAQSARVIEGVSPETLETSAAMYLAEKQVLAAHGATAITINCLGGFYGGHIHAYPCLGFHELNNEGLVGACECDVNSTATMLAFSTLAQGRPGYISDPVIDTAKRQIIYAHCVASNRVFGPEGPANPFEILTHSEDRQGASVRSIMPEGYMTTSLQVSDPRKEILFHQGVSVANDPDDRACRTKLAAEPVGDIEKLFTQWDQWGWHRVTFYGDLKEPVFALADALGWKGLEEA